MIVTGHDELRRNVKVKRKFLLTHGDFCGLAYNLSKQFGPRSGTEFFDMLMVFWKYILD